MDQATADKFAPYLQNNSSVLEVLNQSIPIFHNIKTALQKYHPDILYMSLARMQYDHFQKQDIENEICKTIFNIKNDPELKNTRIAVQAKQDIDVEFLRKLAVLRVSDIFQSHGQAGEMDKVAPQLSTPPSLSNIAEYLTGEVPKLSTAYLNDSPINVEAKDNRIRQLERMLKVANSQISFLKKNNQIQTVPRQDYDSLLNKVRSLVKNGTTDENVKKIFAQVLDSKSSDMDKINDLNRLLHAQNDQMVGLNSQIEELEKQQTVQSTSPPKFEQPPIDEQVHQAPERPQLPYQERYIEQSPKYKNKQYTGEMPYKKVIKVIIALGVAAGLLFGGVKVWHAFQPTQQTTSQVSTPSFNSLIKKGKYVQAAKYYTEKGVDAEDKMLSDPDIDDKGKIAHEIAQYNDSDAIKFDTSYFDQDYKSAADIYNASNDTHLMQLNKARRIMVAYALMKDGQIAKAKSVAQPLNNSQLNERIEIYGRFYHANQLLEAKIKHGDLSDEEITKAKKQISKNQTEMDKL